MGSAESPLGQAAREIEVRKTEGHAKAVDIEQGEVSRHEAWLNQQVDEAARKVAKATAFILPGTGQEYW